MEIKIKLNTNLYPLDVIYSAAYSLVEKGYFYFEGDPKSEIIVNIKLKKKNIDIEGEFKDQLLNYLEFKNNSVQNHDIKQMILHRALITNDPELGKIDDDNSNNDDILLNSNDIEDIDDIEIPWDEKHGE